MCESLERTLQTLSQTVFDGLYKRRSQKIMDGTIRQDGRPVRILVAEDHEIMRVGIRNLLEAVPNWKVCGEAANGREAVDLSVQAPPDVVIMDITMPEINGFEAAEKIAKALPEVPVIMFSLHIIEDGMERLKRLAHGSVIRGAVAKSQAARDLVEAIRSVLRGGTFFDVVAQN